MALQAPQIPRVVFLNSCGDLGDAIPILALIEHYKEIFPSHQTLLYDSVGIDHYYNRPQYVSEIHAASEHLYPGPLVEAVRQADPEFARNDQGQPLGTLQANRLVTTHSIYNRNYGPPEMLYPMDFDTVLADILESDFQTLGLEMKKEHADRVEELCGPFSGDDRPLIGLSTWIDGPMQAVLSIQPHHFPNWLRITANALCENFNARILYTGPWTPGAAWKRFAEGEYVDIDSLTEIPYYRLEIMRRCRFFLGTWSGFWDAVNLLRQPDQPPALQVLTSEMVYNAKIRPPCRNYYIIGGRRDLPRVMAAFRHEALHKWIGSPEQSPEAVCRILGELGRGES
ncbi:MAG: hypothetical protein ACOC2L_00480 [Candidatus Sumerlaeota bacterium]